MTGGRHTYVYAFGFRPFFSAWRFS